MARPWVSIRAPALTPRCRQQTRQAVVCSASDDRPSMFIFGLGYTGIAVANYLRHRGWNVVGTARNEEKRDALQAKGFQVFDFAPDEYELLGGKALECLEAATHVLSTVPPNEEEAIEDPVLMAHMRNLGDKASRFKWIGYISSTSVYGNHDGDWVNEQSEVRATSGKGFIRLMAEHEWLHLYYNYHAPVHIFRCGGIYGPRRSAIEAVRQAGLPSPSQRRRAQQQYTSRVHVYDICQTIEASTRHPNPGSVYNIADDDPAGRLEVMQYAAQLLEQAHEPIAGLAEDSLGSSSSDEQPPEVTSSRGAGNGGAAPGSSDVIEVLRGSVGGALALTRVAAPARAGEKRVSNQRIKRELGVRLAFPTYREGLAAILRNDMRPFD